MKATFIAVRPELVEGRVGQFGRLRTGLDRLSPNGVWFKVTA